METVRKKQKTALYLLVSALVVVAGAVLGTLGMVDYYGAGVLTVFIFYFFHGRKWWCLQGQLAALYWVNSLSSSMLMTMLKRDTSGSSV